MNNFEKQFNFAPNVCKIFSSGFYQTIRKIKKERKKERKKEGNHLKDFCDALSTLTWQPKVSRHLLNTNMHLFNQDIEEEKKSEYHSFENSTVILLSLVLELKYLYLGRKMASIKT